MRIVVILGRVLDPDGFTVNRRSGRIFVNREEYGVQPADRCALEVALRLKEASGGEIIALPRSPLPEDDVLRQAMASGSDRAIYLSGAALEDADDAVMSQVLAAAVDRLGDIHMVLLGAETLDTGHSQLGARLAGALRWPQILNAWHVELIHGKIRAAQQVGTEYMYVEGGMPVVVTIAPGARRLRYPDGAQLINAYRHADAVEAWDVYNLADGIALQPLVVHSGQEFPPARERGTRLKGTAEQMAQALTEALSQRL